MIDPKNRTGNPVHHSDPQRTGGGTHRNEEAEAQPLDSGVQPLAVQPLTQASIYNSVTKGHAWAEFTNASSVAITTGANAVTGNLSPQGGAGFFGSLIEPICGLVLAPTVLSLGSLTQAQTGMSAAGFPGFPLPLSNTSALPAGVGIASVVINTGVSPQTATFNLISSGAGTVAANSRWVLMSITGI